MSESPSLPPIPQPAAMTRVLPRTRSDTRQAMSFLTREIAAGIWTVQAGTIERFYPAKASGQVADVTLNSEVVVGYSTSQSGQVTPLTISYPVFPKVPVLFAGGGGGAMTFPVAPGDTCLLLFVDRDLDSWWQSGQQGLPPNTNRLHSPSDAVALVGLRSLPGALDDVSTTDAQLYGPDGKTGPIVSLGGGKVAIANGTTSLLDVLVTSLGAALTALNAKTGPDASTQIAAFEASAASLLKEAP